MAKSTPVSPVVVVPVAAPSLWTNCKEAFGAISVVLGATTKLASSLDDCADALKSQTTVLKATSANDKDIKLLDLAARIAAHKAKLLADSPK